MWSEKYWPEVGGVQLMMTRLAAAMHERGHEVAVVTSNRGGELPDEEAHQGVPIYRFPLLEALSSRDIELIVKTRRDIAQLKKRIAPHIVHVSSLLPSVLFHLQTERAHPCPTLLTQQTPLSQFRSDGRASMAAQLFQSADRIVSCSHALRREILALFPGADARLSVIHNGVDPPAISPTALSSKPPRLLCVGRLEREKGFDTAIRAMALVRKRCPEACMQIAGDGTMRAELEALAASLDLEGSVCFSGRVAPNRVPELMNKASLVLVPSRFETFGLVAVEAALIGRPVIASRAGGLPEVVEDGKVGLLVEPDQPDQLATAIERAFSDPDQLAAWGNAARVRAEHLFSWKRYADAYEALYQELAESTSQIQ